MKLRNPWAEERYTGPWSDDSSLWTEEFKAEVDFVKENDGFFFCDIDTYFKYFTHTWVNYTTDDMSRADFLKLNDTSLKKTSHADFDQDYVGTWEGFCGSDCTKHTMKLKSTKRQKVFVTAHTWDDRGIAD